MRSIKAHVPFGYSAGGQGAHYLGPKFAEYWAAIAIGGSNATPGTTYPFDRVRNTPMMIFVGGNDTPNIAPSRTMVDALQQHGIATVLKEYAGATHDSAPSAATVDIFNFFDAHRKSAAKDRWSPRTVGPSSSNTGGRGHGCLVCHTRV
jgi:dienelactone hydrolase